MAPMGDNPSQIDGPPDEWVGRDAEPSLEGAFAVDGVDLTLIRWMLQKSPTERLRAAQDLVDASWELRGGREA